MELEKFRTQLKDFNHFEEFSGKVQSKCNIDQRSNSNSVESRINDHIFVIETALGKIYDLVENEEKRKAIDYLIEQVRSFYSCNYIILD